MECMERNQLFERENEKMNPWIRFYTSALAPMAFLAVGQHLHDISGWKTDIPAMVTFLLTFEQVFLLSLDLILIPSLVCMVFKVVLRFFSRNAVCIIFPRFD